MRRALYGIDYDYEDGAEVERQEAPQPIPSGEAALIQAQGFDALAKVKREMETPLGRKRSSLRAIRAMAENRAQRWIDCPEYRERDTRPLFGDRWTPGDATYKLPDDIMLRHARMDWRRAVQLKFGRVTLFPDDISLGEAKRNYFCEIIYQKKRRAQANQTTV